MQDFLQHYFSSCFSFLNNYFNTSTKFFSECIYSNFQIFQQNHFFPYKIYYNYAKMIKRMTYSVCNKLRLNLRTITFLGRNSQLERMNFPRSAGAAVERRGNEFGARIHQRRSREQTKSTTLDGMRLVHIQTTTRKACSLSRCGLVASAGVSFAVVCASQAPMDAPGPYCCRCIRLLSLALLPALSSVLASRIRATRTCSRELEQIDGYGPGDRLKS